MSSTWALFLTQDQNGRPRSSERGAGVIVASTLLAEMITDGRLIVRGSHLVGIDAAGISVGTGMDSTPARIADLVSRQTQPYPITIQPLDELAEQIWRQVTEAPELTVDEVIEALAVDIRPRFGRYLSRLGFATPRYRRTLLGRRLTTALPHEATTGSSPMVKIATGAPLTDVQRFLMTLLASSSFARDVFGHLRDSTVTAALRPPETRDDPCHALLAPTIALLRDMAVAR